MCSLGKRLKLVEKISGDLENELNTTTYEAHNESQVKCSTEHSDFSNARTTDARHRSCKASVILLCELLHLPSCHLNRRSNEFWMFDERLLRMHCSKDHQAAKATAHPDNISSRVSL